MSESNLELCLMDLPEIYSSSTRYIDVQLSDIKGEIHELLKDGNPAKYWFMLEVKDQRKFCFDVRRIEGFDIRPPQESLDRLEQIKNDIESRPIFYNSLFKITD